MAFRRIVEYGVGFVVVVVVGSLLVGQLLGQPILLGFVETGSMAPTMEPGDGFIAVPTSLTGPVEQGDVIVFQAQTLHGGGLTTHRVVDETADGFITKGDANPVTDQSGSEPPVERDQIVAKALQLGGQVVVIPKLGLLVTGVQGMLSALQRQLAITLGTRAVLGTQGLAYLLFSVGVISYLLTVLLGDGSGARVRDTRRRTGQLDSGLLILVLTVLLVAIMTASMVVPAGTQSFTVVSSQSDSAGIGVIPTGESENMTYIVHSNGLVPTVVYLEPATEGVAVTPERFYVGSNSHQNATVTFSVPPETGTYDRAFREHRYIALLPSSTIDDLYEIHPWLPIIAIDLLIAIGFASLALALIGWREIRVDSRGNRGLATAIRRWLR